MEPMEMVEKKVMLPKNSSDLADALSALVVAVVKAHKEGKGVVAEISADINAAMVAFGPVMKAAGMIDDEFAVDKALVLEAFLLGAMDAVKKI